MAQVNVTIAGRTYRMACSDGEEDHLKGLAARLDARTAELKSSFGEIGDGRIVVMAALTLADQLGEAERRIAALDAELGALRDRQAASEANIDAVAETAAMALSEATARVERITQGLNAGARD